MDRDAGWIELLPEDSEDAIARGRLVLTSLPLDFAQGHRGARLDPRLGEWAGRVEDLRPSGDGALPGPGRYIARFEANSEELLVELSSPDSAADVADIHSADGRIPAAVLELGGQ